jgi:hypothetical protein
MSAARKLVMVTRESRGPMDSLLGVDLRKIEARINSSEGDGIDARWEFGRALLRHREGKQLPKGLRTAVTEEFGLKTTEIGQRMQFAETFTTKEEVSACANTFGTWNRIKREALPKKPPEQKVAPFEKRMNMRIAWVVKQATTDVERWALADLLFAASEELRKVC